MLQLQNDVKFNNGESEVQSQVTKGTPEATLKSMYALREAFLWEFEVSTKYVNSYQTS